jgi:hypothetical protein
MRDVYLVQHASLQVHCVSLSNCELHPTIQPRVCVIRPSKLDYDSSDACLLKETLYARLLKSWRAATYTTVTVDDPLSNLYMHAIGATLALLIFS